MLCDLPTILETHKTSDRSQYSKVADVHQILLVLEGTVESNKQRIEQFRASDFQLDDGLTAPMKNVKNRRFSKKTAENAKRMEEIEQRVKELLAADERAKSTNYTLYNSQNKPIVLKDNSRRRSVAQSQGEIAAKSKDELNDLLMDMDQEATQPSESEPPESDDDDDFAAELEEDLLETQSQPSQMDEAESRPELAPGDMDGGLSQDSPLPSQLPPAVLQLQSQIASKRAQLDSVTNPAIRARIEAMILDLERDMESKLHTYDRASQP